MSYIQNKAPQYSSFKSPQFYQNHKPHYFGVKTNQQPKRFVTFNSQRLIKNNNSFNDIKVFPTTTSLQSIPDTYIEDTQNSDIFKNIMMIAVSNKWSENDIANKWTDIQQLVKAGFKGSKKQLTIHFSLGNDIQTKNKRSKSQQFNKTIKNNSKKQQYQKQHKQSPKLQRFHSLNYQQKIPHKKNILAYKSKSVELKQKRNVQQTKVIQQQNKDDKILKLCYHIEQILSQGQKQLFA